MGIPLEIPYHCIGNIADDCGIVIYFANTYKNTLILNFCEQIDSKNVKPLKINDDQMNRFRSIEGVAAVKHTIDENNEPTITLVFGETVDGVYLT